MSFTNDLAVAVAGLLTDEAAVVMRWRPTAVYQPTEVGIFVRIVPPDPDRAVILTPYPLSDDGTQADSVLGLQVRTRAPAGPPATNDADGLADAVFDVLHGRGWTFDTGSVSIAEHQSGVPLGQDQSGRIQRTDNYRLTMWRPGPHRM